ncbi:MAG: UDP-forming cellulose synthase catalytic subunit [Pseudomonadota bacterium]
MGTLALIVLMVALFAAPALPLTGQAVVGACSVAVGLWIAQRAPELRHALAFLSVASSARYLVWRAGHSLDLPGWLDLAAGIALLCAELYGFLVMVLGYHQTAVLRPRRSTPLPADEARWPAVDVLIPSYDEGVDIVERTLIGALAIDYPRHRVHLLDDGRRPAMRALAERLGVEYHTRADNRHAKAGNINAALSRTQVDDPDALVAIFDCDHVPVRSFLRVTAGAFVEDPRLALVQTPHYFYNPDPFERNLGLGRAMPSENAVFYHAVQIGNDYWDSVLFCGSCALIRRAALAEVGGIAVETVTEDAHTSLRMLARGWRSAYLDVPQAAGLATERYAIHIAQRIRWARGMTQILRLDNPLWKRALSWPQRLSYLNAILHFQFGIFRLIYLLAPLSYLLLGLRPLSADPLAMVAYVVPHMILAVAGGEATSRGMRHAFWSEVYEAALAPYTTLVTALAWVAPRHGKFNVTVKGTTLDRARFDWRSAAPNLALLALCLAGLAAAPLRAAAAPEETLAVAVTAAFCAYNTAVLAAAVAVAIDRPQQRRAHRVERQLALRLVDRATGALLASGHTRDLTEAGLGVVLAERPPEGRPLAAQLAEPGGWSPLLPVQIATAAEGPAGHLIGLEMDGPLEAAARAALVRAMFSAPDSWQVEGRAVPALTSLWSMLRVPFRAGAAWISGRRAA